MNKLFLAAGAAALAISAPASADRGEKNGDRKSQVSKAERGGGKARAERRADRAERRKEARAEKRREARSERRAEARKDRIREQRAERRQERRAERRNEARAEARAEQRREARAEQKREARAERRRAARAEQRREARAERKREARAEKRFDRAGEARAERIQERRREMRRAEARRDRDDRRLAERIRERREDLRDRRESLARLRDRQEWRDRDWDRDFDRRRFAARGLPAAFVNDCPPGLSDKNRLCLPPGQYRKILGRRIPDAYRSHALPSRLRDYYRDSDDHYYRYGDGYLYRVDRENDLIRSVLPLIGAGLGIGMAFPYSSPSYQVPAAYGNFYPDTPYSYHRYANGYVYEIDRGSGMIEDIIPLLDHGYGVGQMLPASYSYYNLPDPYRSYYREDDDYLYRYAPGAIYQVDRETQLITAIVSLLTGGNSGLAVGQPLPAGYDMYNVPYGYRDRYYDTPDHWYRYSNGNIYQVDPTTRLITAIVSAIV